MHEIVYTSSIFNLVYINHGQLVYIFRYTSAMFGNLRALEIQFLTAGVYIYCINFLAMVNPCTLYIIGHTIYMYGELRGKASKYHIV